MTLASLPPLRDALSAHGLMANKGFGQHFLLDLNVTRKIARLAVIAQATCNTELVMDLPAKAFTPPPKVDSAVVRLTPRPDRPSPARLDALQRVTAAAFGQRRKMLRASLKPMGGEPLIAAAGLDPQARAETVDIAGFLQLADAWLASAKPGASSATAADVTIPS